MKRFMYVVIYLSLPTFAYSYIAKISQADHYNSRGVKINDAEDILRQDRANYHKFHKKDAEDESDNYFNTLDHRSNMSRFIRNGGGLSQDVKDKIENSNPLVNVEVSGDVVNVSIIDNLSSTISTSNTKDNIPIAKTISSNKDEINNQFKDAALRNLRDEQRALLQKNPDINIVVNDNNDTALHLNVKNKNLDIIKTLIQKGAFVDKENIKGETPLYTAVKYGYMDIAKYLISQGANVNKHVTVRHETIHNKFFSEKSTLLAQAAQNENPTVIKNLLELGANPNMVENQEYLKTPLYLLSKNRDNKIYDSAQALIHKGAKVDVGNNLGQSPLRELLFDINMFEDSLKKKKLFDDRIKTAKLLIERGADLNKVDNSAYGACPTILGANLGLDFIKYMQKHGAKLDIVGNDNFTMLHEVKDYDSAKYLLEHGLKKYINYIHSDETPLYISISNDNYKLAKLYLENGADIHKLHKGDTLLESLYLYYLNDGRKSEVVENRLKIAKLLLDKGIDINHKDENGQTVIDKVIKSVKSSDKVKAKVLAFLIKNGAKFESFNNSSVDNYFTHTNGGDIKDLKYQLTTDAYEHVISELRGLCQDDISCQKSNLKKLYGAKKYVIFKKEIIDNSTFYVLVTTDDNKNKIVRLTKTKDGISFGTK